MKSLIALQHVVLEELGTRCGTSTIRDAKTVAARIEHEGLSFLTITLPTFGADFQKSLDQGFVGSTEFRLFAKNPGGLPKFLGGFLSLVFDAKTGSLLEEPSILAIYSLRQLTLMFEKVALNASPRRHKKAMVSYLRCEREMRLSDASLASEPERVQRFQRIGRLLWADFFSRVDTRVYQEGVVPRHGPGSTADRLRGNAKYDNVVWTRRLESVFPHWENLIPSESFLSRLDGARFSEPGSEIPVRVVSVPKTLKTPRIIAIEPTCMQYMQQGVLEVMVQEIPRFSNTRELICFESQEPNQRLAREGSLTGRLATLDLSEASDRVSNQHVRLLLANHRSLRESVDATRSRKAEVLGKTYRLSKFASMGSALCFPFEALVFTTIVFMGIERGLSEQSAEKQLTAEDVQSFYGRVRVYGDDIIIPVEFVQPALRELAAFGLLVNLRKSFWNGKFRESCGKEYYHGTDVSIARVRRVLPSSRRDVAELISTVSLRNQLFKLAVAWDTVDYLDRHIQRLIPFPWVEPESVLLGRWDYTLPSQQRRSHPSLFHPLVKGVRVVSESPPSQLDDYGALMKWFLKRGYAPFEDRKHLERSGRPRSVHIKTRWARPY